MHAKIQRTRGKRGMVIDRRHADPARSGLALAGRVLFTSVMSVMSV